MAILDLQGMQEQPTSSAVQRKSRRSRFCHGGGSHLSLLLC
jgi:hypothetical protein